MSMRDFLDRRKAQKAAGPEPQAQAQKPKKGKGKGKHKEPPKQLGDEGRVTFSCGCSVGVRQFRDQECRSCQRKRFAEAARRNRGRLPHGSTFRASYDDTLQLWKGILTVKTSEGKEGSFMAEHSGVRRLLEILDDQYRQWVEIQKEPS